MVSPCARVSQETAPLLSRTLGLHTHVRPRWRLPCLDYLSARRKTTDYHLIRLLHWMRLRHKFLSPTCAPDLGDVDTYFFFEKIFRSDIRICVIMTSLFWCSDVTGNLKKYLRIHLSSKKNKQLACSLVSYLSQIDAVSLI